jgi:hypothetical protein
MKNLFFAFFFSGLMLGNASSLWACETTLVTIGGNLDAQDAPIPGIPAFIYSTSTFGQLANDAGFSTFVSIYDSLGSPHTVTIFFYHTGAGQWVARAVVEGSEVGGTAGFPAMFGADTPILFDENGIQTLTGVPPAPATITAIPAWSNGADPATAVSILFDPFTQFASASNISAISHDGSVGACPRRNGLDFDGDGIEDRVIWRPSTGMWAILKSAIDGEFIWKQWGLPGDYPMAGDYTGDSRPDLVVWRPSDGNWYVCRSETNYDCFQAPTIQQFGLPGDRPIRGDFDGDGVLDYSVWRPSTDMFYLKSSRDGSISARQWGLPGDIPVGTGTNR